MKSFNELNEQLINEAVSSQALKSYLTTALWSSTDDNDDPMDKNYDIRDIDKRTMNQAKSDLSKFFAQAKKYIKGHKDEQVAHDFWLNRNGHGAGFWDGDYEFGDELDKLATKFREVDLYVGDDGKVYS
jgi:hypothetical protein